MFIRNVDICFVNFFAHYHFDQIENNPIHNFGLLTPDLLRNFTPNLYNKKKLHHLDLHNDWQLGIQKHILRDHIFHQSPFFKVVYDNCHTSVKNAFQKQEIPRFWFALHVWIEMLIDKVIINQHKEKLDIFYQELASVQTHMPTLLTYIDHQNIEQFQQRMNRFVESKYLFHYQEHSGIIYGLNRVFIQVKAIKTEWTEDQQKSLYEISETIEKSVIKNWKLLIT